MIEDYKSGTTSTAFIPKVSNNSARIRSNLRLPKIESKNIPWNCPRDCLIPSVIMGYFPNNPRYVYGGVPKAGATVYYFVGLHVFCRCGKLCSPIEPTKDSTQRNDAVNSLYVSTPPPKWLALLYSFVVLQSTTLEGLSLSMLVLSQQFMPLIGNHDMSCCHRFHRQQVCQLCKWLWQQKSEFWMGASWRLFGIQTKRRTHRTQMPGTPLRSSSLLKFVNSFVHRMD